jgi:hypothetical protein
MLRFTRVWQTHFRQARKSRTAPIANRRVPPSIQKFDCYAGNCLEQSGTPYKLARYILKRKVAKLVDGAVNCEVTLEIALGVEIVSIITKASTASLGGGRQDCLRSDQGVQRNDCR